jgi:hypothetical protein
MCSATLWLTKGASIAIALALCLFLPNRTTLAEDTVWKRCLTEAKKLRQQGRYAESKQAHLLAIAEAEKFGPEDRRLALSLNELAALYHTTGRLREAEPLYRRPWSFGKEFLSVWRSPPP